MAWGWNCECGRSVAAGGTAWRGGEGLTLADTIHRISGSCSQKCNLIHGTYYMLRATAVRNVNLEGIGYTSVAAGGR